MSASLQAPDRLEKILSKLSPEHRQVAQVIIALYDNQRAGESAPINPAATPATALYRAEHRDDLSEHATFRDPLMKVQNREDYKLQFAALHGMCRNISLDVLSITVGAGQADISSADSSVTRPQYVAKIDAICKKTTQQSKQIFTKLQTLVDASGTYKSRLIKAAPLLRKLYKVQSAKLEQFKATKPPTDDRAKIAQLTKVAQQTIDEFRDFLPAAEAGDLEKFIDIATDASGARADAEQLGTSYGLREDCFSLPVDLSNVT